MIPEHGILSEQLLGREAKDVVLAIVQANPQIKQIAFVRYDTTQEGLDLFWQYPGLVISTIPPTLPDFLDWLTAPRLQHENSAIGVISLVEITKQPDPSLYLDLRHEYRHIPMASFDSMGQGLGRVKSALRELGQTQGVILDAGGGSYHFYGSRLMLKKNGLSS